MGRTSLAFLCSEDNQANQTLNQLTHASNDSMNNTSWYVVVQITYLNIKHTLSILNYRIFFYYAPKCILYLNIYSLFVSNFFSFWPPKLLQIVKCPIFQSIFMRITLIKPSKNQREHKIGWVVVIIRNCHFLYSKPRGLIYPYPHVIFTILRFSPQP